MKTFLAVCVSAGLLLGPLGCRKQNSATGHSHGAGGHDHGPGGHEHAPEAEVKTAQITVWTNGYEIFAEHTPPVAGRGTRFITHISEIATGKPRTSGGVKFVLRQGTASFEHPQAGPERPGIYIPAITFPKEGEWETSVIIPGASNATVNLGTIRVFANDNAAATAEFPEAPEGISFLKEQQWRILAKTEVATKRRIVERVPLHATVVATPGGRVEISSPVAGRLLPNELARWGAEVKGGDVLGWVEPAFNEFTSKLVEAEAEADRAKFALEQTKATFERTRSLFEQQAKSQRELQEAEVAYRTAQAASEAAVRIQQLYRATGATFEPEGVRIPLKAPFAGVVDRISGNIGGRIEAGAPLITVVDPNAAMVQAQVPEARLTRIRPELGATLQLGEELVTNRMKFVARGRELDPNTRTVSLTFEVEGGLSVPLGATGTLLVTGGEAVETVAIPSGSVVEEEGVPIAFVQVSGETFEKRDVTLGLRDGDLVQVTSGINDGERVVKDGAYALLLSTKSGTIPAHGHAH